MRIYSIYKATNIITKLSYIGFTCNYNSRRQEHKRASKNILNTSKFYTAVRAYGWDNFEWSIIYQSTDKLHTLNLMEPFFINEFDSKNNGYNSTYGGEGILCGSKSVWWNNGITELKANYSPNDTYSRGRLPNTNVGAIKGAEVQRGKIWINDGVEEMMILPVDQLPDRFVIGRLSTKAFNGGNGRHSAQDSVWWNNGIEERMQSTKPEGFIQGRISGRKWWNDGVSERWTATPPSDYTIGRLKKIITL